MRQAFRSLVSFGLLLAVACAGVPPPGPVGARDLPLQIRSSILSLNADDPQAHRVGKLIWRGGIAMTANSRDFGGWSDLHVSSDGRTLVSISDVGGWFTATINYDADTNLVGLSDGKIGSLRGLDGRPLASKEMADAEGMARLPDGAWLVSFEGHHRIWRYPTLDGTPVAIDLPADFDRQPSNGGVETLTALPDGRIIAISEEYTVHPGANVGWIGQLSAGGHYTWQTFDYATIPDFHPTAIRLLPDGSIATIERAFDIIRGMRCRVMRFPAAELRPGGTVRPQELARLAAPYTVDNLEGLAAIKGARGETLLWLISDDNFNPLQRNILLMFELEE
jgi:hypothetical protein